MAIGKGVQFSHVTIEPGEGFSGYVQMKKSTKQISEMSEATQKKVLLTLYAGVFAQKKYTLRFNNIGASEDYNMISDIIYRSQPNSKVSNAY
jgi:hypothetical protein